MQEIRLIDANALCRSVDRYKDSYPAANAIISVVAAAPTVEPVRYARWVTCNDGSDFDGETVCTGCNGVSPNGWWWRYCPHCGAKMNAGDEQNGGVDNARTRTD
jgi:hypothetical protein